MLSDAPQHRPKAPSCRQVDQEQDLLAHNTLLSLQSELLLRCWVFAAAACEAHACEGAQGCVSVRAHAALDVLMLAHAASTKHQASLAT